MQGLNRLSITTNTGYVVTYKGFLQEVKRKFDTYDRALQWLRQCGKEKEATINGSKI